MPLQSALERHYGVKFNNFQANSRTRLESSNDCDFFFSHSELNTEVIWSTSCKKVIAKKLVTNRLFSSDTQSATLKNCLGCHQGSSNETGSKLLKRTLGAHIHMNCFCTPFDVHKPHYKTWHETMRHSVCAYMLLSFAIGRKLRHSFEIYHEVLLINSNWKDRPGEALANTDNATTSSALLSN
jgi:hypothetical protein